MITEHPKSVTGTEWGEVTFSSNACGDPEPQILWMKDGSAVMSNENISLSDDQKKLTIKNLTEEDCGRYKVMAKNSVAVATSESATLTVQRKY